ncbi:MAG: hypothetical protein NC033_03970 [Clostridiales bacterium]|nr:hypothetical protein [Clostridiales bacterium]
MNKTDSIDLSADRLISIAADCVEDHDFIAALKMLNKNAVLNGNDEDSFMLYAEAFDDMGLYEKCVNGWFKYIDYAGDAADLAEAYEGIAVSFMNMGMDSFAAFYYNKLLMETDSALSAENRREIIDAFLSTEKPPLRFAYPPRLVDYSAELEKGVEFMRNNEFDSAVEEFSKVDEGSEKYVAARNYIAMCEVISDRNEQAEEECLAILRRDPENIQALTTLAAVKSQQHKSDEAKELACRLLKINPDDGEELYKIATVCCENGMHEQAYSIFCRLDERFVYDCSLLFFKAVAAYNSGKVEKSLEIFDTLLTIYPNAVTADYWHYEVLSESKKPADKRRVLDYFYRLPKSECEVNISFLTALNRLSDSAAGKLCEQTDVGGAIHWCFDEGDSNASYELKLLGAMSAVKCGLEDTVRDILLDAFLQDGIKLDVLSALVEKNREGEYGIVVCNLYKRVTLVPLNLGRNKKKVFMRAYALAFSRFAMLETEYPFMLSAGAEGLYNKLDREGRLNICRSEPALAAAIIKFSEIKESGLGDEQICSFFGTNMQKVNEILGIEQ